MNVQFVSVIAIASFPVMQQLVTGKSTRLSI